MRISSWWQLRVTSFLICFNSKLPKCVVGTKSLARKVTHELVHRIKVCVHFSMMDMLIWLFSVHLNFYPKVWNRVLEMFSFYPSLSIHELPHKHRL